MVNRENRTRRTSKKYIRGIVRHKKDQKGGTLKYRHGETHSPWKSFDSTQGPGFDAEVAEASALNNLGILILNSRPDQDSRDLHTAEWWQGGGNPIGGGGVRIINVRYNMSLVEAVLSVIGTVPVAPSPAIMDISVYGLWKQEITDKIQQMKTISSSLKGARDARWQVAAKNANKTGPIAEGHNFYADLMHHAHTYIDQKLTESGGLEALLLDAETVWGAHMKEQKILQDVAKGKGKQAKAVELKERGAAKERDDTAKAKSKVAQKKTALMMKEAALRDSISDTGEQTVVTNKKTQAKEKAAELKASRDAFEASLPPAEILPNASDVIVQPVATIVTTNAGESQEVQTPQGMRLLPPTPDGFKIGVDELPPFDIPTIFRLGSFIQIDIHTRGGDNPPNLYRGIITNCRPNADLRDAFGIKITEKVDENTGLGDPYDPAVYGNWGVPRNSVENGMLVLDDKYVRRVAETLTAELKSHFGLSVDQFISVVCSNIPDIIALFFLYSFEKSGGVGAVGATITPGELKLADIEAASDEPGLALFLYQEKMSKFPHNVYAYSSRSVSLQRQPPRFGLGMLVEVKIIGDVEWILAIVIDLCPDHEKVLSTQRGSQETKGTVTGNWGGDRWPYIVLVLGRDIKTERMGVRTQQIRRSEHNIPRDDDTCIRLWDTSTDAAETHYKTTHREKIIKVQLGILAGLYKPEKGGSSIQVKINMKLGGVFEDASGINLAPAVYSYFKMDHGDDIGKIIEFNPEEAAVVWHTTREEKVAQAQEWVTAAVEADEAEEALEYEAEEVASAAEVAAQRKARSNLKKKNKKKAKAAAAAALSEAALSDDQPQSTDGGAAKKKRTKTKRIRTRKSRRTKKRRTKTKRINTKKRRTKRR